MLSGGDQTYQAARVQAGNDIALVSGGSITFEAVKDLHQEAHEKTGNSLSWNSSKGRGNTDETLRQTQLLAQGNLTIKAVDGLKIDYKHLDRSDVSQAIDAMVQADPNLAWLKEAEQRGDVDWRAVKELHDSYSYSHSGMGQGTALVIAIIVTYLTWGAGSSLVGVAADSATGLAANSVVSAVATNAATSAINNRGDLGAVAKDVTSSDALKSYAAAGIGGAVAPASLGLQLAVRAATKTVLQGGNFIDNAGQAAIDMAAAGLAGYIYQNVGNALLGTGIPTKVAVHAIVGGLIAEAAGGDFRTAALAAGANEAVVAAFGSEMFPGEAHDRVLAMTSQLIGITVAAGLGGDSKAQEKAGWVAQQATVFNNLEHESAEALLKEIKDCRASGNCGSDRLKSILTKYEGISAERSNAIADCPNRACVDAIVSSAISMKDPVAQELLSTLRQTTYDVAGLLNGNPGAVTWATPNPDGWGDTFALDKQLAFAKYLREGWLTPEETADLDRWNASTSWLDQAAGKQLDIKQKAFILTELGTTAAMALLGGRGAIGGPIYKTNKEAKIAAEALGFKKINETVHGGQAVFKRGNQYITRDLDGHNGGAWKMADSVEGLGSRKTRSGTFDENLNRIGD